MQNFHLSRYQKGDKRKSKKRDFQHTTEKKKAGRRNEELLCSCTSIQKGRISIEKWANYLDGVLYSQKEDPKGYMNIWKDTHSQFLISEIFSSFSLHPFSHSHLVPPSPSSSSQTSSNFLFPFALLNLLTFLQSISYLNYCERFCSQN